jgi:hypothetical protein
MCHVPLLEFDLRLIARDLTDLFLPLRVPCRAADYLVLDLLRSGSS